MRCTVLSIVPYQISFQRRSFFFLDDTFTGQADRQTDLGISK